MADSNSGNESPTGVEASVGLLMPVNEVPMRPRNEKYAETVLGERDAMEFSSVIGFRGGVIVGVYVGGEEKPFILSREFLTKHSAYFRGCFEEGNFIEGKELAVTLDDVKPEIFAALIQYMVIGSAILPQNKVLDTPLEIAQKKLMNYLEVLILADRLMISPSPNSQIIGKMRGVMKEFDFVVITRTMIRKAWLLPAAHLIRKLFLEGCVMDYIKIQLADEERKFVFDEELSTVAGFATDLFPFMVKYLYANARGHEDRGDCPNGCGWGSSSESSSRANGVIHTMTGHVKNFAKHDCWNGEACKESDSENCAW